MFISGRNTSTWNMRCRPSATGSGPARAKGRTSSSRGSPARLPGGRSLAGRISASSLHSQGGIAYHLDFSSGSHVNFPLEAHVDLNSGEVTLTWMPLDQAAHSSTFRLAYVQKLASHGPTYFFDTEQTTDEAVYSLTVVLL